MKDIIKNINKVILGAITVVVIFFLGFLWWVFKPVSPVPMWVLSLVIILCYIICIIIYAVCDRNNQVVYVLPKILAIHQNDEKIIFLLEKNELFVQGSYVTIVYQDEDDAIEFLLGIGYIETVNSQGNMQVVFEKIEENIQANSIISEIKNNKHYRNALKIKPCVLKSDFLL